MSPHIATMMATSSVDGQVKIWDVSCAKQDTPLQVSGKKMQAGELFGLEFYKDIPYLLACGGSEG
jgi:periodic tryptophan protein 1